MYRGMYNAFLFFLFLLSIQNDKVYKTISHNFHFFIFTAPWLSFLLGIKNSSSAKEKRKRSQQRTIFYYYYHLNIIVRRHQLNNIFSTPLPPLHKHNTVAKSERESDYGAWTWIVYIFIIVDSNSLVAARVPD